MPPNVNYTWKHYVSGQPEFRDKFIEPEEAHKWVKEQTANGTLVIGEHFLFIDTFELLHFPSREMINSKKMITLALQTGFFKKIIVNTWSRYGDTNFSAEFTCVPYELYRQHFWELLHVNQASGVEVLFNTYNMPLNYADRGSITQWCGYTIHNYMRDDLSEEGVERAQSRSIFRAHDDDSTDEEQIQEEADNNGADDDGWNTPSSYKYSSTWETPPISYTPTYDGFRVTEWRLAPILISLAKPC